MLLAGEIDALIGPRTPSAMTVPGSNVGWLFPDPRAAAIENYRRTGNFPIMHLIGVRRTLAERHPWLPAAVLKAFDRAKAVAFARLADTSASKVMLPFVDQQLAEARRSWGPTRGLTGWMPTAGASNTSSCSTTSRGSRSALSRLRSCSRPRRSRPRASEYAPGRGYRLMRPSAPMKGSSADGQPWFGSGARGRPPGGAAATVPARSPAAS